MDNKDHNPNPRHATHGKFVEILEEFLEELAILKKKVHALKQDLEEEYLRVMKKEGVSSLSPPPLTPMTALMTRQREPQSTQMEAGVLHINLRDGKEDEPVEQKTT